jgi:N-acetylated-alpha-linked acidic dipeptidase
VLRALDAPLHPFDWTQTTAEFRRTLQRYQAAAGSDFDFAPSRQAVDQLDEALQRFYAQSPVKGRVGDPEVQRFNFAQRRLARYLVPVNFSEMPMFFHDPALDVLPLPDLAPALSLPAARDDVARRGVLRAHLTRGQNRFIWTLQLARETVEAALETV